jgi:hypothetical protein
LLLIAGAALFQLLSKVLSKTSKTDSTETSSAPKQQIPRPIQRTPRESDADRIRKFLEALGQPPSSTSPAPVLPRPDIPSRPLAPVQPPPVIIPGAFRFPRDRGEKPNVTERENAPLERQTSLKQIVAPPEPRPATPAFEVHKALPELQQPTTPIEGYAAARQAIAKRADYKMDIATLLASKSSLREAILLREILGTPRGLQELDLM